MLDSLIKSQREIAHKTKKIPIWNVNFKHAITMKN